MERPKRTFSPWKSTQAETTTTIKNLTIVGSADTKSGIHAYNCTGTVKLEDVTIQNCGNAAVQVNSSKVEATNLNTEGNVWGAINVDKGASLDTSPLLYPEQRYPEGAHQDLDGTCQFF